MPQLKLYYIDFPYSQMRYDVGTVLINNDNIDIQSSEICRLLNSDTYDFSDYSTDITIIVDGEGFYKSGLPIWSITTLDGYPLELIGKLLFARNIETECSVDLGSIKTEDIFNFRIGLNIKLLGMKK